MTNEEFIRLLDEYAELHKVTGMPPQSLVKGKKYRLKNGEEVVFEALMPDHPPVRAAVYPPDDENDVFTVPLADIIEEADQRWRGTIIP